MSIRVKQTASGGVMVRVLASSAVC